MPPDPPSFGGLLLQLVISLALVCGLAYLIIRFGLARWLKRQRATAAALEVLETLPLGGRRAVHLVRSLDRLLVIGSTDQSVSTLADLGPGSAQEYDESTLTEALAGTDTESIDPDRE